MGVLTSPCALLIVKMKFMAQDILSQGLPTLTGCGMRQYDKGQWQTALWDERLQERGQWETMWTIHIRDTCWSVTCPLKHTACWNPRRSKIKHFVKVRWSADTDDALKKYEYVSKHWNRYWVTSSTTVCPCVISLHLKVSRCFVDRQYYEPAMILLWVKNSLRGLSSFTSNTAEYISLHLLVPFVHVSLSTSPTLHFSLLLSLFLSFSLVLFHTPIWSQMEATLSLGLLEISDHYKLLFSPPLLRVCLLGCVFMCRPAEWSWIEFLTQKSLKGL